MKVSVLYGKKITNGANLKGYVIGVNADGDRITTLTCADKDENIFYADFKSVKSVKGNINFRGEDCGNAYGEPVRLGKPVFDCGGNFLGVLSEMTYEGDRITGVYADKIRFDFADTITGDAVLIKNTARILKSDVKKGNRTIIKRGTPLTAEVLQKAEQRGEYVQASLKCL